MDGEVKGMPGFQLYREFIGDLEYVYHRVTPGADERRQLIARIDQIKALYGEGYALFFESFMSRAKVVEVRNYGFSEHLRCQTVRYESDVIDNSTSWHQDVPMLVRYDRSGTRQAFTFPDADEDDMRFTAYFEDLFTALLQ
jgi:hypothetical protein